MWCFGRWFVGAPGFLFFCKVPGFPLQAFLTDLQQAFLGQAVPFIHYYFLLVNNMTMMVHQLDVHQTSLEMQIHAGLRSRRRRPGKYGSTTTTTLIYLDQYTRLVVRVSGESLGLLGGNGGVPLN